MPQKSNANRAATAVKTPLLWAAALIALLGAGLYIFDGLPSRETPSDGEPQLAEAAARPVEIAYAVEESVEQTLSLTGELRAYEEARLSFKIPGYVRELHFQPGDSVEAGEPIAKLDETDFALAVRRAEAELQQARARLGLAPEETREPDPHATSAVTRARAERDEAERRVQRIRQLRETDSASQSELDAAETEYEVARHSYQEAIETALERVATLAMREAELEQAEQNLAYTVLEAPFDGVIREKLTGPGAFLEEGDAVYHLVRTDTLRLRVEIPERDVHRVYLGQQLRFRFSNGTETHAAELTRLLPQLEEDTRVLIGEADVENPGPWRPGMFVRAELVAAEETPAITVPASAITSFVGIYRVFVVEDGAAVAREVEIGRAVGDRTVITDGLSPNEEVIVEPGEVRSGDAVDVASAV